MIQTKFDKFVNENYLTYNQNIFFHGSTDENLDGKQGIHIGTKLAATQALEARIGIPATGEWDGTREYGNTPLAGKKTLKRLNNTTKPYCETGFNC